LLVLIEAVKDHSGIARQHTGGKMRRENREVWALLFEEDESLEGHERTAPIRKRSLSRSDSHPVHLSIYSLCSWLTADSTDSNDRIEIAPPNPAHAIFDAEVALGVRVAFVSALVNQSANLLFHADGF
jgi:hypothetical protein